MQKEGGVQDMNVDKGSTYGYPDQKENRQRRNDHQMFHLLMVELRN
jgi:hypothetical protein